MIGRLYFLADPREPSIARYYGQTIKSLTRRLEQHITAARRGERRHVARWIRGLMLSGSSPAIVLVAELPIADLDRLEKETIAAGRRAGLALCNLTDGGGGAKGWTHSPETRARMSLAARGPRKPRTLETKAKLAAANIGKRATAETRAKLSAILRGKKKRPRSPEHCAKLSAVARLRNRKHEVSHCA